MREFELTNEDISRFWGSINIKDIDSCWDCILSESNNGYSNFQLTHYDRKKVLAHRLSWFLTNGPIPIGKLVLHKCDNKRCCNPNHLYIGNYSDNLCDAHRRGKRIIVSSRHASKIKFYAGEIWLIRKLKIPVQGYANRKYQFSELFVSKMFKVSQSTIHKIWNSNGWLCKEGYYA